MIIPAGVTMARWRDNACVSGNDHSDCGSSSGFTSGSGESPKHGDKECK